MNLSRFLCCLILLLPMTAAAEGVPLKDPVGALAAIDKSLATWTFDEAFHAGDTGHYLAKHCVATNHCPLTPFTFTVLSVTDSGATLRKQYEGEPAATSTFARERFGEEKNFLRSYFTNLGCAKPAPHGGSEGCEAHVDSMREATERLGDGNLYRGIKVDYTLESSWPEAGGMFVGTGAPWVARFALLQFPGEVLPWAILQGFERKP